jgi:type I restriction enzyme S subunit
MQNKGTGSTFKAISKSILNDPIVPLPPLETQQKIISILEKAEEMKKLRAQAVELTPRLRVYFGDVWRSTRKSKRFKNRFT